MAEDSETMKVEMLRVTGRNSETQWFEYRPGFLTDIVRIEWELDTKEVELDAPVAEYLLRAGYAAPLPQGSAPEEAPQPVEVPKPVEIPKETPKEVAPPPWQPASEENSSAALQADTPPSAPSWLNPSGG